MILSKQLFIHETIHETWTILWGILFEVSTFFPRRSSYCRMNRKSITIHGRFCASNSYFQWGLIVFISHGILTGDRTLDMGCGVTKFGPNFAGFHHQVQPCGEIWRFLHSYIHYAGDNGYQRNRGSLFLDKPKYCIVNSVADIYIYSYRFHHTQMISLWYSSIYPKSSSFHIRPNVVFHVHSGDHPMNLMLRSTFPSIWGFP